MSEGWQPIETAPVGEEVVFAYFGPDKRMHGLTAVVKQFQWESMDKPIATGWPAHTVEPTHWLRLPKPPALSSHSDEGGGEVMIDTGPGPAFAASPSSRVAPSRPSGLQSGVKAFQVGVDTWMDVCFGAAIKADVQERCDRFIEEALEFIQAAGYSAERAHALVDYTFGRPVGEINQEVGGVMVTLAAMCNTVGVDIGSAAETELARVWTKVDVIRAKQAAKPTGSALPVALAAATGTAKTAEQAECEASQSGPKGNAP